MQLELCKVEFVRLKRVRLTFSRGLGVVIASGEGVSSRLGAPVSNNQGWGWSKCGQVPSRIATIKSKSGLAKIFVKLLLWNFTLRLLNF